MERIAIVGIGYEGFRPSLPDLSAREIMFEAAYRAYNDAEIDPRKDVDSFICCEEDLWEGWSITDEMVPDQIGAARRPLCTIPGDGIIGLGHAIMQIRSGIADVVVVESHSKTSDVIDKQAVENMALDPTYIRQLGVNNDAIAALEMSCFLASTGFTREDCSEVVVAMKKRGLRNERASFSMDLSISEVQDSEPIALPLRRFDKAEFADCAIVMVLASESWARKRKKELIYLDSVAWCSASPFYECGEPSAKYISNSFKLAAKEASMRAKLSEFDLIEVDDTYSYKLLQHLFSIVNDKREVLTMIRGKGTNVNLSGGSLSVGNLIEANGLYRVLECALQLSGRAGLNQRRGIDRALAISWRGIPTATGGVAILSR